jgi:fatty-acyl-CoA synthase
MNTPSPMPFKEMPRGLSTVMNLGQLLDQTARKYPDRIALVHGDQQWTWQQINQRVNAVASALKAQGALPGQRLLVQLKNGLPLFESAFVAFKLGMVWVPVNFRLTPSEVAYVAQSSTSSTMLTQQEFAPHAQAACAAHPGLHHVIYTDDEAQSYAALTAGPAPTDFQAVDVDYHHPLWFFYTSGTTGRPKAAVLTHGQMAFVVTNHLADLLPGLTQHDASLVVAPLSHGAGIHALVNVARGAVTVLLPGDSLDCDAAYALIEKYRVGNMFTVPTILKRLAEFDGLGRYDHSSLRHVIYAGAPMYRVDQERAIAVLGCVIVQYFGLGEVTGNITVLRADEHALDHGKYLPTCGTARAGMEVAILDAQHQRVATGEQGEICTRGPAVFAGYWDNPEATTQAFAGGWFHTGDLGVMDARGFVTITGRSSDMYISGGSNVYPREVEELLLTLHGIAEVAVVGMPDAQWGESGVAVVVAQAGAALSAPLIQSHLDGKLSRYKWPKNYVFWDALPKSAYGKIAKKDVKAQLVLQLPQIYGSAL